MSRGLIALGVGFAAAFAVYLLTAFVSAAPPVRPEQPRPDIFQYPGIANMQTLNPVTMKAKDTRAVSYRLITMPGCTSGTIPSDMVRLEQHMKEKVQFSLVRNDAAADFTVRINCGNEQIRICGSINVFCLNRGFPYTPDVEISDVLSNWAAETRLAILCHEICGHAIGTWNEQYATCGRSCNFAPSPNWRDFMNTGPDSRHGFETIELERWARTMYELAAPAPFYSREQGLNATSHFGERYARQQWGLPPLGPDSLHPFDVAVLRDIAAGFSAGAVTYSREQGLNAVEYFGACYAGVRWSGVSVRDCLHDFDEAVISDLLRRLN